VAITLRCPECQQVVQFSDHLAGLHGRCPLCSATVTVREAGGDPHRERVAEAPPLPTAAVMDPRAAAPAPRDFGPPPRYEEEEPRYGRYDGRDDYGRLTEESAPAWGTTRTALTLIKSGMLVVFFALLGVFVVAMCMGAMFRGMGRPGRGEEGVVLLAGGLWLATTAALVVGGLLWFIGTCMCCSVPTESGAKGLAIGSMLCLILYVLLILFAVFMLLALGFNRGPGFGGGPEPGAVVLFMGLWIVAILLGITSHILFVLFLRSVARFFGNESVAGSCIGYLVLSLVWLFGLVGFVFFMGFFASMQAGQGMVQRRLDIVMVGGLVVFIVMWLVAFFWLLNLVGQTRDLISRSLSVRY
jgi:hypothetical protein